MSVKVSTTSAHPVSQNPDSDRQAAENHEPGMEHGLGSDSNPCSVHVSSLGENHDRILADLVEELAAQMHATGSVDWQACAREHPEYVDQLRELLPALEALAGATAGGNAKSEVRIPNSLDPEPRMNHGLNLDSDPCSVRVQSVAVLGDFRLIREIGRGGMGVVYEAEQVSLNRRVALKILPFAAALDSRHLQRFKTEAQAAAQLHHTNIVPVYAVGSEQGTHYYAMQFIDGRTLADVIQSRIENRRSRIEDRGSRKPGLEQTGATVENGENPTRSSSLYPPSSILDSGWVCPKPPGT